MHSRDFQRVVAELQSSIPYTFGVIQPDGKVIACSDSTQIGSIRENAGGKLDDFTVDGAVYVRFQKSALSTYFVFVDSVEKEATGIANVISASMRMMSNVYEEKNDRKEFIKGLAEEKIDQSTLYSRLKSLGIVNPAVRYVCVFHGRQMESSDLYNLIDNMLVDRAKDFLYVASGNIVLVKEAVQEHSMDAVMKRVDEFVTQCCKKYDIKACAGISEMLKDLAQLPQYVHQGEHALNACYASDPVQYAVRYDHMGTAGLIATAEQDEKQHFLAEIFPNQLLEQMDEETLFTIRKLFENDLNITETSKKLFINRNTLIYRLNRIEKDTGLDLKRLDDAVYFRLALMVYNDLKKE